MNTVIHEHFLYLFTLRAFSTFLRFLISHKHLNIRVYPPRSNMTNIRFSELFDISPSILLSSVAALSNIFVTFFKYHRKLDEHNTEGNAIPRATHFWHNNPADLQLLNRNPSRINVTAVTQRN